MPVAVADTSGLVALVHADDSTHAAATAAAQVLSRENTAILVPSEVFAETINLLGKKVSQATALQTAHVLLNNSTFVVKASDTVLLGDAAEIMARQPASVSFIDSLVMAWATKHGNAQIFGFDSAFARNGYKLPDNPHRRRAA